MPILKFFLVLDLKSFLLYSIGQFESSWNSLINFDSSFQKVLSLDCQILELRKAFKFYLFCTRLLFFIIRKLNLQSLLALKIKILGCFFNRYALLDNGEALVIDVRTERELLEDGVIQGALNIPLKQLKVNHSV